MQDQDTQINESQSPNTNPSNTQNWQSSESYVKARIALDNLRKSSAMGASWLYAIAAFSLINMLSSMARTSFVLVVGLGTTQVLDGMARNSPVVMAVALPLNILIMGIYAALGYCARRQRMSWAFVAGMVMYSLDTIVILMLWLLIYIMPRLAHMQTANMNIQFLIMLGFHLYALRRIYQGYKANCKVNEIEIKLQQVVAKYKTTD